VKSVLMKEKVKIQDGITQLTLGQPENEHLRPPP
jgi:hypothetical protein